MRCFMIFYIFSQMQDVENGIFSVIFTYVKHQKVQI